MDSYAMLIPPKAKLVWEFGCGDGQTGREFKKIQPAVRYVGFENEETAISTAVKYLNQVVATDNLNINPAHFGAVDEEVDCLIFHGRFLRGAWGEQVQKLVSCLADDGQALFIIENVNYWPDIIARLQGEEPVLPNACRLSAVLETIKNSAMFIDKVFPLYRKRDQELRKNIDMQKFIDAAEAYRQSQNLSANKDGWAKHFVIRVVKKGLSNRLMIHTMVGEVRVTARVRVYEPHAFIGTMPGVDHVEQQLQVNMRHSMNYSQKVLIIHRVQPGSVEEVTSSMARLRQNGYLLLCEIDDSPDFWRESYEKTSYISFVGVHAVQVSTEPLKNDILQYNPHVVVFPNHLKELPPPKIFAARTADTPVNIFFGALNREKDWEPIMPALNALLREFGERVTVTVMFDRKFYAALETAHKVIVGQEYPDGYAPYRVYAEALHEADISLLPLADNERSRMKSDLKFIESAGHSAAVLASPVVYAATVRDGGTGLIYRSPEDFARKLCMLIENRDLRCGIAESAYDYVKHHRLLSQHYEERVATYRELIAKWKELEDDLSRRLEKLANMRRSNA